MKKLSILISVFVLLLVLVSCGQKESPADAEHDTNEQETSEEETEQEEASEEETEQEASQDETEQHETSEETEHEETEMIIYADTGNEVLEIEPADNSSAAAFISLLEEGDVTVDMHDYGDFEKVGSLGSSLPTNDESITTEPGDVILYQGNQITIYYDTNTWTFTRLGKVRNLSETELKEALGAGDVTVVFSLD